MSEFEATVAGNVIRNLLKIVDEPNRIKCLDLLVDRLERKPFRSTPGSRYNHQAWEGGYLDHVAEVMRVAVALYDSLNRIRKLPFNLSDALLVLFLHDLEKPYKYSLNLQIPKHDNHEFRIKQIELAGIKLTHDQLNAITYVEGENDDYRPDQRVMGPLAAFCHMCDVCSARIWFNQPWIDELAESLKK